MNQPTETKEMDQKFADFIFDKMEGLKHPQGWTVAPHSFLPANVVIDFSANRGFKNKIAEWYNEFHKAQSGVWLPKI